MKDRPLQDHSLQGLLYITFHNLAHDYVVLEHRPIEQNQEPVGFFGRLGKAWNELVYSFNGEYEFDGYVNCAPYYRQGRDPRIDWSVNRPVPVGPRFSGFNWSWRV